MQTCLDVLRIEMHEISVARLDLERKLVTAERENKVLKSCLVKSEEDLKKTRRTLRESKDASSAMVAIFGDDDDELTPNSGLPPRQPCFNCEQLKRLNQDYCRDLKEKEAKLSGLSEVHFYNQNTATKSFK